MTGSLPRIQRRITTATGTPTRHNRTKVTPANSAEERDGAAGVEPVVEAAVSGVPVLITEQAVMFSTAAAVTVSREKITRAWVGLPRLRRLFTSSTADARPATRRYRPRRYSFLDQATMAREMDRL
jgi:hypothetical protein